MRMNRHYKWIPDWTEPTFFPNRIDDFIHEPTKGKYIFVGSMSDICYWELGWKEAMLELCEFHDQATFIFLTKDPRAYHGVSFPDNCILGLTVTGNDWGAESNKMIAFYRIDHSRKFVSVEPILGGSFEGFNLGTMERVIVGANSNRCADAPKKEWIDNIRMSVPYGKIFWKPSIKPYL
jgi:protein gp37